jgi:hypothetical protein
MLVRMQKHVMTEPGQVKSDKMEMSSASTAISMNPLISYQSSSHSCLPKYE